MGPGVFSFCFLTRLSDVGRFSVCVTELTDKLETNQAAVEELREQMEQTAAAVEEVKATVTAGELALIGTPLYLNVLVLLRLGALKLQSSCGNI